MSFVGPGQVVTYLYWKQFVQQLGLGDTSTPDTGEIRLFQENTEYILKIWNGTAWVKVTRNADLLNGQGDTFYLNAGNLNAGILALERIPSTLTGKNADQLDGQHGSYYQNASNLNSGTVSRDRLGALWRDSDSDQTNCPFIQTGKATISQGTGTQTINFDYAYIDTPRVSGLSSNNVSITILISESTSGFIIQRYTGFSFDINWIAIGRKA